MSRPSFKLIRTPGSRWGPGKVHRMEYDSLNREWWPICRPGAVYHGATPVPNDTPLSCAKCIRAMEPPR